MKLGPKLMPTMSEQGHVEIVSELPKGGMGERTRRYEHLKTTVAALRSKVRSAPTSGHSTPPPSLSSDSLVPYAAYLSKFSKPYPACSRQSTTADDSHQRQIEVSGLLESYAMQALRLDCELKLKETQEEVEKLRERLKDKSRRTEHFDRELERQRKKLEAKIAFFSDQSKLLEQQLSEQAIRHAQDLQLQTEAYKSSVHSYAEKKEHDTSKLISTYEDSVEALRKTNEAQTNEIEKLEREYSFRLEQMERSKAKADNHMKYLDGQMKLVAEQAAKFRTNYEEQEKEWNLKLQHVTAMHQFQIKSLRQEYELQLEKLRKERDEEKEQQNLVLQTYKTQKLKDMEYVEERVKGVLEAKEATIVQLKQELTHFHQQLLESTSILEDDNRGVASQLKKP